MTLFPRLFKLFILVIITPLFVTGVFLFYYQNHSKKEVLTNYLNIAQISSKFIRQNVENTSLRFDFINDITPKLDKNKKAVQEMLDETLFSNPDFVFLAVLDSSGKEVIRSASKDISSLISYVDLSSDPSIKNISTKNIAISGFETKLPLPFVEIVYPTQDGKYLFAIVSLFDIWDKLSQQNIGASGGIYFATKQDGLLGFNRRLLPEIPQAEVQNALSSPNFLIKKVEDFKGDVFVGAFAPSAVPDTYIMVLQYQKEAYYTISLITWLIVFFILATTTLSYFAALSFSQEVSDPVEKLTAAAQKISENDFNVQLDAKDVWGEFEILINTFNAMARRLAGYQAVQLDKLLDEKRKTDLLAGLMRDGLVMCSLDGAQLYANKTAQEILQSDALCHNMECTIHGSVKRPELINLISVQSGTVFNYQKNGKNVYFEVVSEVFKPAQQDPVALVVFRDITTEHEINEMKNDIFNSVAHDLRAPLLGLQAYLMILREGDLSKEEQQKILATMDNSSKTLTSLIENILDVSKLERGIMVLNKTSFDLSEAAQKVIQTLSPLAQEKKITLTSSVAEGSFVFADRNLIDRVFTNLVSNALKFTEKGGVEILHSVSDGWHTLTVKDTGIGIKESHLSKIFEKYHQTDRGVKGYGLGLTIVRSIVMAHGGQVGVASQDGKGSSFTFTLPAEDVK